MEDRKRLVGELSLIAFFTVYFSFMVVTGLSITGLPSLFPMLVNGAGVVFIGGIAVHTLYTNREEFAGVLEDPGAVRDSLDVPRKVVTILLMCVAYAVLTQYVGLLLATVLFLLAYAYLYFDRMRYVVPILIVAVLAIYVLAIVLAQEQRLLRGTLLALAQFPV